MGIDRQRSRIINKQRDVIMKAHAQTAIWRRLLSRSGGAPAFGIEPTTTTQDRSIELLVRAATIQEVESSGGQLIMGDLLCDAREKPDPEDMFIWDNEDYHVASSPSTIRHGNAKFYRFVIRRSVQLQ